ncbi:uncharacterized protein G2W53_009463 [Senna tora]|uniref:Uncharacterized protein n=1 Tax=Senna tora TaxID=362788 RepID=A0A834WYH3_9FABA|nr:uncharacterized protein G2W53_009463 [Senna tora]
MVSETLRESMGKQILYHAYCKCSSRCP